jgi:hypothetical protein
MYAWVFRSLNFDVGLNYVEKTAELIEYLYIQLSFDFLKKNIFSAFSFILRLRLRLC